MKRFLVRRFGQAVVTIFGVLTLVFFLQRLTGDPVYLLLPDAATQEDIDALRHALGFDRPLAVQYFSFIADFVRLDLGRSVAQKLPVTTILASRIPFTLALAGGALLVAGGLGLTIGALLGAFHRHPLALPLGVVCGCGPEHADLLEWHSADPCIRGWARVAAALLKRWA